MARVRASSNWRHSASKWRERRLLTNPNRWLLQTSNPNTGKTSRNSSPKMLTIYPKDQVE